MNENKFNTHNVDCVTVKFPAGFVANHIMDFSAGGTTILIVIQPDDKLLHDKDVKV